MANKLYEETHIQNIANAIREKTGKTDTMTIGQMAGEIQGIANLPTDALEGLEGGYDVMFYDENKIGLAMYSIKAGHSINPPVYDGEWQLADGSLVTFPYTPTADSFFYILKQTYADQLYTYYGMDKVIYPYLYIWYEDANPTYKAYVYFAKTVDGGYCENVMLVQNYKMTTPFDTSTIASFMADLRTTLLPSGLTSASAKWGGRETSTSYYYYFNQATYDVMASQLSGANIFNLDE